MTLEWLATALLDDTFPIEKAEKVNLPAFFAEYSLHDSSWYGLWTKPNRGTIAIIRWDTCLIPWKLPNDLQEAIPGGGLRCKNPFLIFDFSNTLHQMNFLHYPNDAYFRPIIGYTKSKHLSPEERYTLLEGLLLNQSISSKSKDFVLSDNLYLTVFEDLFGGQLQILHDEDVYLLCLSLEGNPINIPSLE